MINLLYMSMSGLNTYSKALENVSNNVQNLNTVGYKKSELQFFDLFSQSYDAGSGRGSATGSGVTVSTNSIDFSSSGSVETGRDLDLRINGDGFFVLRDEDGQLSYSKAGRFEFNTDNVLVSSLDPSKRVMALDDQGQLREVSVAGHNYSAGQASTTINFNNGSPQLGTNISTSVDVYDASGAKHVLTLQFTRRTDTPATSGPVYDLVIKEGATVYNGPTPTQLKFDLSSFNLTEPTSKEVSFTFNPPNVASSTIKLSVANFKAFSSGSTPTQGVDGSSAPKANGRASGTLSTRTFDTDGNIVLTYTNGEKVKIQQLALAKFGTTNQLQPSGGSSFVAARGTTPSYGRAGKDYGEFQLKALERSNVDLTRSFSEIILFQRSFQASSQMASTANEILQVLFQMKGH
ncbi:MAG TPA: flagellar hook-basal body complex protein [Paucimonas sp.]|nr:flagellar hook-basal body complex protein [Paucimonas sp.]